VSVPAVGPETAALWESVAAERAAVAAHPFLAGLAGGTLPRERFADYVLADAHYLGGFARALAVLAARSPVDDDLLVFSRHAAGAVEVERALHAGFVADLGLSPAATAAPPAPAPLAYTSYLLATVATASYAEGLAAVLPCYWIYADVGAALAAAGSPDPLYARWISTYGGEEFAVLVGEALAVTERVLAAAGADERDRARACFATATRYEWMFWDAAWRGETWPLG